MAARRPAKIASAKKAYYVKECPVCKSKDKESPMAVIKMVRHSKPSGMYWVCSVLALMPKEAMM